MPRGRERVLHGSLHFKRVVLCLHVQQFFLQIKAANFMDLDTYSEPVQRLADLEWLSHKDTNDSVLDDTFNGQLVESVLCTVCNKATIHVQTFNVLPVPIADARELNGLVYLNDCFEKCTIVEQLAELKCELCCKRAAERRLLHEGAGVSPVLGNHSNGGGHLSPAHLQTEAMLRRRRIHRNLLKRMDPHGTPTVGGFSPIGSPSRSDSQLQVNSREFRTSTPIHGSIPSNHIPPVPVLGTEGRRRTLLRRLPSCLVIHLLRFDVDLRTGESHKLQRPVNIQLDNIDLSHLVVDNVIQHDDSTSNAPHCYSLHAVCVHLGAESLTHGHYVAYVKTKHRGWCRFNDELVTPVNMAYEIATRQVRENAYLLFFKKTRR